MAPDGSTIFVESKDQNMYAINADVTEKHDNRLIWNYNSIYDDFNAVSSKDGSLVYAFSGSDPAFAFAIEAKTGNVGWNITLFNTNSSSSWHLSSSTYPVISPDGNTIYFGVRLRGQADPVYWPSYCQPTAGNEQTCLLHFDAVTGALLKSLNVAFQFGGGMVVSKGGNAAFTMNYGIVNAFNPKNGSLLWNSSYGMLMPPQDTQSLYTVSPDGNHLFAAVYSIEFATQDLIAINARTGALSWVYAADKAMQGQPVVSPDSTTVFVGCDDHSLYAFHTDTGRILWTFRTGGAVGPPTVTAKTGSGGTVVFVSQDGAIYEVDAKTGVEIWAFQMTPPISDDDRSDPDSNIPYLVPLASPDGSKVFVASGDGVVYALSTTKTTVSPAEYVD
jgi:outer membrane protein assembly factor BamB